MSDLVARTVGVPTTPRSAVAASSALASLGAAGIHAWVVPEHFREYWLFGGFFIAVAIGQLAWAGTVTRWPNRISYSLGAAGSLLLIALWAVSRTVGLPVGPEHWQPEPTGALDGVCVVLEVAVVALAAVALRVLRPEPSSTVGARSPA